MRDRQLAVASVPASNETSPCGYEHELSTPGAWATGDVLLTLASQNFASWNQIGEWLRRLDAGPTYSLSQNRVGALDGGGCLRYLQNV